MGNLTYGTDPEFACILNTSVVDNITPPAALIADYGLPFEVNDNHKRVLYKDRKYGSVIEDGAAVELNVTPCDSLHELKHYSLSLKDKFVHYLYSRGIYAQLSHLPVATFDTDSFWNGRGEDFRDCVRFGCDPDFFPQYYLDIGLEKEKPHEIDVSKHRRRYFGGHIHVGSNVKFDEVYSPIVFDFTVGLINAVLYRDEKQRKLELERLKFYGHPGRGRIQKWGYEYRPPSNFWLRSTPAGCEKLQSAIQLAVRIIEEGLHENFFHFVRERIPEMWSACVNLDTGNAKSLYKETAFAFAMEYGMIKISQIKKFVNLEYL